MPQGMRQRLFLFSCLLSHWGCNATSRDATLLPPTAQLGAGTDDFSKTSSAGTPYLFRNVAIRGGGFVTGIVFSHAKPGVVYARTDVGGAYRFDPARRVWLPLMDMFGRAESNLTGVESIAADPHDADKVYAAVGTYAQSWAPTGAILRSSDRGTSWQRTEMPVRMGANEAGRQIGERLVVDPNKTDHLWFGSRKNGLWRSVDAGVSWNEVASFPERTDPNGLGIGFLLFDSRSTSRGNPTPVLYVAMARGEFGLYVTTDGGESFRPVPQQPHAGIPTHGAFDARGTLYLSYANAPGPNDITRGAVYKYEPASGVFTDITPLAPSDADRFGYGGLAVDIQHPGTLLASTIDRWRLGDEIFRSTDAGVHWSPLLGKAARDARGANYLYFGRNELGRPAWVGDIEIDPFDASRVMHASGHGVWASADVTAFDRGKPIRFEFMSDGLEASVVTALVSPPRGAPVVSGVADVCGFRHDDLDAPPRRGMHRNPICNVTTGLDFAALKPELMVRSGTVWGKGKHGALSEDGGASWIPFAAEPRGAEAGGRVAIAADGSALLWALPGTGLFHSRDRGASWKACAGVRGSASPSVSLGIGSDRVNPHKFYAFDPTRGVAYLSEDGGSSFRSTQVGLAQLADWARDSASIQVTPSIEGDVWLTTGHSLSHSTDSGTSYRNVPNVTEAHAVGFGKAAPGRRRPSLFLVGKVGDIAGLFRSDDSGRSFVRLNDDAHQFGVVSHITGDARQFGRVYLGTGGRGIIVGEPR